ncbi:MAG: hypothetical protein F6K55_18270 [Moorea sp. SIO4A3]|nr:hypothetical protein [Moorena sp. SIO4A3]
MHLIFAVWVVRYGTDCPNTCYRENKGSPVPNAPYELGFYKNTIMNCDNFCSLLPTPYSLFPIPCSLFPIPCSLLYYLNSRI